MVADREGWEQAIWAPIIVCSVPFLLILYTLGTNARVILRPRSQSSLSVKNILLLRNDTLSSMPKSSFHHKEQRPMKEHPSFSLPSS